MIGDLCVCDDGLEVWASLPPPWGGPPRIRFGPDQEFALPTASSGLAACRVGTTHVAMIRGHNDHAYSVTRDRVITDLGTVVGTYAVGVTPHGDRYWINALSTYRVNDGVFPVPKDASGQYVSGQGWTQILDGVPRWTAFYGHQTIEGRTLTRCVQLPGWIIGMDTAYPRIVAYRTTNASWWLVANSDTQTGPQAVVALDGSILVAISGADCRSVHQSQFVPLPPIPPVIPTFQKTSETIGIGLFDDLTGPRIQDPGEVVSASTRAIFWQIGKPGQSATRALANSINWGAEAYKDTYGLTVAQVPDDFRALVYAYPSVDLSVAQTLAKVEATLKTLHGKRPIDLAAALYCNYKSPGVYAWPLQKVLDILDGVWDLAIEYEAGAVWGFTKRRVTNGTIVDGVEYWPALQTCYARLKAASGDWQTFPPYADVPPPDPWFTSGRSFLVSDLSIRGLRVTVDWDYTTHQAIHRFLRVPPGGGDEDIFWDAVEPGPETAVTLRRRGPGECDALFTLAQRELALQPDTRWWQTRPKDAVGPFETFRDVAQPPNGLKTIVHVYGQLAEVVI